MLAKAEKERTGREEKPWEWLQGGKAREEFLGTGESPWGTH